MDIRRISLSVCVVLLVHLVGGWPSSGAWAQDCRPLEGEYQFFGARWLELPGDSGTVLGTDVGDLDGDGLVDAVASVRAETPLLRAYLATEPLCFELAFEAEVPLAGQLFLEDVTGDSELDVIVFSEQEDGFGISPEMGTADLRS